MPLPRSIRLVIAMAVLVLSLAALLLILTIGESTLNIQAHLDTATPWAGYAWWGTIAVGALLISWIVWRLIRPSNRNLERESEPQGIPSEQQVISAIDEAEILGADTQTVRRELLELQRRREAGEIHVALFGEVSTGKSSLIKALLPDAEVLTDVRGGTTRELNRYQWISNGGDRLTITDMPGTSEAGGDLDPLARDEAKRAHVVIYVTDSDLNRVQHTALDELKSLNKPLILVLTKTDRLRNSDVELLSEKLRTLVADQSLASFVTVTAATHREVVRQLPDGSEIAESRELVPRVQSLALALQRLIDGNESLLDELRDSATFVLAKQHLDAAVAASRLEKADQLVDRYAMKAVVGALAAITPGSDLLIQGYLGTQLIRELAALYGTKVGKVDTELLLKLVQQHVGRAHTLLLAVAGNALKAFPGVGTLAGGAMHAVAYGIIFRTLGRALTSTLATRGEIHPRQTAKLFEEKLVDDLDTPARSLARVVIEQIGKSNR